MYTHHACSFIQYQFTFEDGVPEIDQQEMEQNTLKQNMAKKTWQTEVKIENGEKKN